MCKTVVLNPHFFDLKLEFHLKMNDYFENCRYACNLNTHKIRLVSLTLQFLSTTRKFHNVHNYNGKTEGFTIRQTAVWMCFIYKLMEVVS